MSHTGSNLRDVIQSVRLLMLRSVGKIFQYWPIVIQFTDKSPKAAVQHNLQIPNAAN